MLTPVAHSFTHKRQSTEGNDNMHNNNNHHDSIYGAIAMIKVIARVHPVHLMNAD